MEQLLDANVLLARFDEFHDHQRRVLGFLDEKKPFGVITCPITENGFVRIFANPTYTTDPGILPDAIAQLRRIRSIRGHTFITDDVGICDSRLIPGIDKATPKQLTDLYLLALAVRHSIHFVTMNTRIPARLVTGGSDACLVIPA